MCAGVPTGYIPGPGAIQGRGRANKVSKISNLIASLQSTNSQTCLHYFPVYTTTHTRTSLYFPHTCVSSTSLYFLSLKAPPTPQCGQSAGDGDRPHPLLPGAGADRQWRPQDLPHDRLSETPQGPGVSVGVGTGR